MKLIHVGVGRWGLNWELEALPPVHETVQRVAIVDEHEPTLAKAQETLKLPDAMCFSSLDAAIDAVDAELVLITAPMVAHVPIAIQAMEAGKHVLVEKPFAGSLDEAREAVQVAEKTGKTLMVSQNYRFYPAPKTVAQMVADRTLGDAGTVYIDFRRWSNDDAYELNRHYQFRHALLFDMAIHHYDLMRIVLGQEAVKVYAHDTSPAWSKYDEEAEASLIITFANGQVVSYRGSWVSSGEQTQWAGEWRMEFADGEVSWTSRAGAEVGARGDEVHVRQRGSDPVLAPLMDVPVRGRSGGLKQLVESIEQGIEPESSGRSNLGTVAIMEAAVKSAATGKVVDVEQIVG